jgi:hypothetical protein
MARCAGEENERQRRIVNAIIKIDINIYKR